MKSKNLNLCFIKIQEKRFYYFEGAVMVFQEPDLLKLIQCKSGSKNTLAGSWACGGKPSKSKNLNLLVKNVCFFKDP